MRSVMERFLPIKLCTRQSRDRGGKFDFTARPPICNPIISIHRPTGREASENFFCIAISHACWWLLLLIDGKKIIPQPSRAKLLSAKSNQTESLRPDSPTGRPRRERAGRVRTACQGAGRDRLSPHVRRNCGHSRALRSQRQYLRQADPGQPRRSDDGLRQLRMRYSRNGADLRALRLQDR